MFVKYGALKSIKIKEDKKNTVAEQGSDYGREIPESLFPSRATVGLDESKETIDGFSFGDVALDALLAPVETDFTTGGTDVAVVGIGHFAGAVDDAAHDGDLEPDKVGRGGLDAGYGSLEVVERTATAGTTDVLGAGGADAGGLEDGEGDVVTPGSRDGLLAGRSGGPKHEAVCQPVEEERSGLGGSFEHEVLGFLEAVAELLENDYRVRQALSP